MIPFFFSMLMYANDLFHKVGKSITLVANVLSRNISKDKVTTAIFSIQFLEEFSCNRFGQLGVAIVIYFNMLVLRGRVFICIKATYQCGQ